VIKIDIDWEVHMIMIVHVILIGRYMRYWLGGTCDNDWRYMWYWLGGTCDIDWVVHVKVTCLFHIAIVEILTMTNIEIHVC